MAKIELLTLSAPKNGAPRVLWIGSRQKTTYPNAGLGRFLELDPSFIFPVSLADLNADLISHIRPTVACSMLTWIGGDALEAAAALEASGFTHHYWAFGPRVPCPSLVENEVRASAPGLVFSIVELTRREGECGPSKTRFRRFAGSTNSD